MATKKAAKKKPEIKAKSKSPKKTEKKDMVTVFIMGKAHKVPAEATIMGAIEYAGYQIKRGAGCREGFCGACATVYRLPKDYKNYTYLCPGHGALFAQDPSQQSVGFPATILFHLNFQCVQKLISCDKPVLYCDMPKTHFAVSYFYRFVRHGGILLANCRR